jgi:hypothetical protein
VWFIAAIAAVCRRLEPTIQWRSQIVFGSGLVGVAAGLNGSWDAVLFRASERLGPEVARFAFDLGNVVFASSWVAVWQLRSRFWMGTAIWDCWLASSRLVGHCRRRRSDRVPSILDVTGVVLPLHPLLAVGHRRFDTNAASIDPPHREGDGFVSGEVVVSTISGRARRTARTNEKER